jgi:hypothetical protein
MPQKNVPSKPASIWSAAFTMARERYGVRWKECVKLIRWVYAEEAKKDETPEGVRVDTVQITSDPLPVAGPLCLRQTGPHHRAIR